MRIGLFGRTLAGVVALAVFAIGATAWVSVARTTEVLRQEQGESLAGDTHVYDVLLGWAATHPGWDGVAPIVHDLAGATGRRVVLRTRDGRTIADTAQDPAGVPSVPAAVVDPLSVDVALLPTDPGDRIDPRAAGPFRLSEADRAATRTAVDADAACLRRIGFAVQVVEGPTGRARVEPDLTRPGSCPAPKQRPTAAENDALQALTDLATGCLHRQGLDGVRLSFDRQWRVAAAASPADRAAVDDCLAAARREQLRPYVAPAALLYLAGPGGLAPAASGLPRAARLQLAGASAAILACAILVAVALAGWLARPVRALTGAVRRMRAGDRTARVTARAGGEVGELTAAFNEMSEHLQRTEEQRRHLLSDVSHELRAPLSNLRLWLEATQDGLTTMDAKLVASLLEETLLLQRLVDDLRDVSLADVGALAVHPAPVAVADLFGQVAAAYPAGGVTVSADAEPGLTVRADPVRLRQALGNLLSNALRHTPPGGTVTLRGRRAGDEVVLEVADTGAGLDADQLPLVFERFWRADPSRSRATGGSGLGLAIVRGIALAHGGSVAARGAPGRGATFELRLPAGASDAHRTTTGSS
ncbi:sensor histidine kinase [Dactylosporangium sp. CA-092794]|uniref:sensor histidine kinase n=1 Tax=Dactylosporangium sp. CA-092794 TaxID=3239929 RepID=UPI003D924CEC